MRFVYFKQFSICLFQTLREWLLPHKVRMCQCLRGFENQSFFTHILLFVDSDFEFWH